MSDQNNNYFADLLEAEQPQSRTISRDGKEQTVYFRRITAAERVKLLRGQRVHVGGENKNTMDLDIGDLAMNRHLLVLYSTVKEDGKQVFRNIEAVQALPDWLVSQLAKFADEVNKDEDEAGKA
jgi:hypothetical protein